MPVKKGREGVRQEMHKFKHGELHSGSKEGPIVEDPAQAIAISLHEAGMGRPSHHSRTSKHHKKRGD